MNVLRCSLTISSLLLLSACSISDPFSNIEMTDYSTGENVANTTSFYWYTERQARAYRGSDYVRAASGQIYQTSYRWEEGHLRELIRSGQLNQKQNLVPFSLTLRFNEDGDPVYQDYRVDNQVIPLKLRQMKAYGEQAAQVAQHTKQRSQDGYALYQGIWDGKRFNACDGNIYRDLTFTQVLPSFLSQQLSQAPHYVAVAGSIDGKDIIATDLLVIADSDHKCINTN
jgi:hypothetical protein